MDTMFENLDFRFDKENNDERPFMIACKDREIMDPGYGRDERGSRIPTDPA